MNKYLVKLLNTETGVTRIVHYMGNTLDAVVWHLMDVKHPKETIKSVRLL